ncbi:MAG: DNA polymerase III subunit chi [Bauldia sp.]|nr:DNA polymerase III subunit chi [Bauldia sp.]
MTEVLFYHLQRQPLEAVLPALLERSLERGWRVVVQAGSRERVEALDAHLWTYRDESFLPHGIDAETAAEQPVFLTEGEINPNRADVRFVVDGAAMGTVNGYQRVVLMFDGNDEAAVAAAREAWKGLKDAGHNATYWQQNDAGRWEKKA